MRSSKSGPLGSAVCDVERPDTFLAEVEACVVGRQVVGISSVRLWTVVLGGVAFISLFALWDVGVFESSTQVVNKPTNSADLAASRGQGRLHGFVDTWVTSSDILCSNNLEYSIADVIVPVLYNLGFTANGVVALNVVVRGFVFYAFQHYKYITLCLLLLVVQVLDAADGQLARAYSMTSSWGHWLDHVTDEIFTATFMAFTLYMMSKQCGWTSRPVMIASTLFVSMVVLGASYMHAITGGTTYQECSLVSKLGMYQMLYMSYIEIIVVLVIVSSGSVPSHANAS